MFTNYLKIITRNIRRQPLYTTLNLLCLTTGIAATLLIVLYLHFEIGFDRFHEKANRVFRVETDKIITQSKTMEVEWQGVSAPIAGYLKKDYPEVKAVTRVFRFFNNEKVELTFNQQQTSVEDIQVMDSTALEIFTFEFVQGPKQGALDGPNKIILSEKLATKIFGNINPIGQVLETNLTHILPDVSTEYRLQVTGVFKDLPNNTHLPLEALISATTDPRLQDHYFGRFSFPTYVLLNEQVDKDAFGDKISEIYRNYLDPDREPVMKEAHHRLVPLTDIHLEATGGASYLYIFGAIAALLLLISIISFVNLMTAQASKRAMEIGVRKVMGSSRQQLLMQFLSESVVFSLLATVVAIVIVLYSIPILNNWLDLQLVRTQLFQPQILLSIVGICLLVGLLGGSYPAFFLSAFQPIQVLKGQLVKSSPMRRVLVAVQFAVVLFVLICTGMINEQLQFMRQKDLGFNKEQVVHLELSAEGALEKVPVLKNTLQQSPHITSVGTASFLPGLWLGRRPISADNGVSKEPQFVEFGFIDYDYLQTLDIDLTNGRNFSTDHPKDATESVIVNEQFAKSFGLENLVGEPIRFGDSGNPNFETIVGVIEDFHSQTLHEAIGPQVFFLRPASFHLAIKIQEDFKTGIAQTEKIWKEIYPNDPFSYQFMDEELAQVYQTDQIRGRLFTLFSILTLLIAFLGLFGLVAYIAQQRVKEIGVRRVLGASTFNVVSLLSKDFLWLVVVAALPAGLLAWYFVQNWLEDFAYRTEMNYFLFLLALLFLLLITILTTSFHTFRVTRINPAETLKQD